MYIYSRVEKNYNYDTSSATLDISIYSNLFDRDNESFNCYGARIVNYSRGKKGAEGKRESEILMATFDLSGNCDKSKTSTR